jgi:hypothetical protein
MKLVQSGPELAAAPLQRYRIPSFGHLISDIGRLIHACLRGFLPATPQS